MAAFSLWSGAWGSSSGVKPVQEWIQDYIKKDFV